MANNKIDRINKEIAKTREKITEYQNKLKGLEAQKTGAENLEIDPAGTERYAVRRRYSRHERRTRYRSGRLRRTGGKCR